MNNLLAEIDFNPWDAEKTDVLHFAKNFFKIFFGLTFNKYLQHKKERDGKNREKGGETYWVIEYCFFDVTYSAGQNINIHIRQKKNRRGM